MRFNLTWKELKTIIRKNNFKTRKEYWDFINKNKLNIPKNPDCKTSQFKKKWTNWPDFLESETRSTHHRKWRSFKKSRDYARSFNFNTSTQWIKLCKTKKFPIDIPTSPSRIYKKQWKGWSDWLGNTTFKDKPFVSYSKAKKWMNQNNIKSYRQWIKVRKSKPDFIPSSPNIVYKKEWKGCADFFSNGYVATYNRKYISYKECKQLALKLKIKSQRHWQRWAKSKQRSPNIPSNPSLYYKKDWISWNDFLQKRTKPRKITTTYQEAKEFISKFRITSGRGYKKFVNKNFNLEINLPTSPESFYKKEWEGWEKFLKFKRYPNFEEAKEIVQKLGIKSRRHYKKLHHQGIIPLLPVSPETVYSRRSRNW